MPRRPPRVALSGLDDKLSTLRQSFDLTPEPPQKEGIKHHHTQTPNYFYDWLGSLNAAEIGIWMYVSRKTHGFHKETDKIANSQFVELLNVSQRSVIRAVARLEKLGLLKVTRTRRRINEYECAKPAKSKERLRFTAQ